MAREQDRERLFSENVDRLLAGDERKASPSGDADLETATEFAGRMAALRSQPSAQFQAKLKASLLQKLNEQEAVEAAARSRWPAWLLPRRPVWQVVYVALFIVLVGGVVWGVGVLRSGLGPARTPAPGTVLQVDASVDRSSYRPGEEVRIHVALKNVSPEPFAIEKFPPMVSLMRTESGQPVFTFAAGRSARTLPPDGVVDFVVVWDQRDDLGRYVPGGSYYLELEDIEFRGRALPLKLSEPVRFEVQPTRS